jgi:hypothetical protein
MEQQSVASDAQLFGNGIGHGFALVAVAVHQYAFPPVCRSHAVHHGFVCRIGGSFEAVHFGYFKIIGIKPLAVADQAVFGRLKSSVKPLARRPLMASVMVS